MRKAPQGDESNITSSDSGDSTQVIAEEHTQELKNFLELETNQIMRKVDDLKNRSIVDQ